VQDKEFIIIRDAKIKKELAEACYDQGWIANAPAIIVLFSDISKLSRFGARAELYAAISAGAAIQNLLLSLTDQGLQGTEVGLFDETALKRILKIPSERKIFAVIPLGVPAEKPPVPRRLDLSNFTHFDSFGNKWTKDKPKIVYENY
jgi:nitroreductase